MSILVAVAQQERKVSGSSCQMTEDEKPCEFTECGLVKPCHLIARTTLAIAEMNAPVEHNTELSSLQPFGELFSEWLAFCADVDFDSDIWSFKIPKGTQYGPDLKLAEKDIFGYVAVQNKKIMSEFIFKFQNNCIPAK